MDQPRWLELAWRDLGVAEMPGSTSNPTIVRYYADVGQPAVTGDEVAWCAAFLGACLERAGVASTRSLAARSYLAWGKPLAEPRLGAIAVLSRGSDPALGHVGFLVGHTTDNLYLLGGNQSDAVCVSPFPRSRLIAFRWPAAAGDAPAAPVDPEALFERALAHVLAMEGGWSDDPYDPGGPTNFGITLAVYAREKGVDVTAANVAQLKSELRRIAPETVRRIYRERYWCPAACPALPPALAVMHFDAAVNHGVAGAMRMLQQALAVAVDGEVGPETLGAAKTRPIRETLHAYAAIRRQRYRALPHFWRFGRGWLNRVDRTLAFASALADAPPSLTGSQQQEMKPMTTDPQPAPQPASKWWAQSMTIWGTIVTTLSTVLPAVAPLFGYDITADLIQQLGDQVVRFGQAAGGLIGVVLTIYGRVRATSQIERRPITLSL
jgi:uncharacterized protein (TIGR02594 family)